MGENWGYEPPILAKQGYCVFALTYGVDPRFQFTAGVLPIQEYARAEWFREARATRDGREEGRPGRPL